MFKGTFVLNGKDMSSLNFPGIGKFRAFSGNGRYLNRPGCTYVQNDGALPTGKYLIVDRPQGGFRTRYRTFVNDLLTDNDRSEWFALYREDGSLDDYTWINGVRRGGFRLHPGGRGGISLGCLTMLVTSEFHLLRNVLLSARPARADSLHVYGEIEVIAQYDEIC